MDEDKLHLIRELAVVNQRVEDLKKEAAAANKRLDKAQELLFLCGETFPDHTYKNESDGFGCVCKTCRMGNKIIFFLNPFPPDAQATEPDMVMVRREDLTLAFENIDPFALVLNKDWFNRLKEALEKP